MKHKTKQTLHSDFRPWAFSFSRATSSLVFVVVAIRSFFRPNSLLSGILMLQLGILSVDFTQFGHRRVRFLPLIKPSIFFSSILRHYSFHHRALLFPTPPNVQAPPQRQNPHSQDHYCCPYRRGTCPPKMTQTSQATTPNNTQYNSEDEYDKGASWYGNQEVADAQHAVEVAYAAQAPVPESPSTPRSQPLVLNASNASNGPPRLQLPAENTHASTSDQAQHGSSVPPLHSYTRSSVSPSSHLDQAQHPLGGPPLLAPQSSLVPPGLAGHFQHAYPVQPYANLNTQPSFFAVSGTSTVPLLPSSTKPRSASVQAADPPFPPSTQPRFDSLPKDDTSAPSQEASKADMNTSSTADPDADAVEDDLADVLLADVLDEAKLELLLKDQNQSFKEFLSSRVGGRPSKESTAKVKKTFSECLASFRKLSTDTGIPVSTLFHKFFAIIQLTKSIKRGGNPWNTFNRFARTGNSKAEAMKFLEDTEYQWDGVSVPTYEQVQRSYWRYQEVYGEEKVKEAMELWESGQELQPGQEKGARLRAFDAAVKEMEELGDRYRNFHQINMFGAWVGGRVGTDQSLRYYYNNYETRGFLDQNIVLEGSEAFMGALQTHIQEGHLETVSTQTLLTLCELRGLTVTGPAIDNLKGQASKAKDVVGDEEDAGNLGNLQQVILAVAAENKVTFPRPRQLPWDSLVKTCLTSGIQIFNYPVNVTTPWDTARKAKDRRPLGQKSRRQGIKELLVSEQKILLAQCQADAKDRLAFLSVNPLDLAINEAPVLVYAPDQNNVRQEVYLKDLYDSVTGLEAEAAKKVNSGSSSIVRATRSAASKKVKREQENSDLPSSSQKSCNDTAGLSCDDDDDFYDSRSEVETPKASKSSRISKRKSTGDEAKTANTKRQKTETTEKDVGAGSRKTGKTGKDAGADNQKSGTAGLSSQSKPAERSTTAAPSTPKLDNKSATAIVASKTTGNPPSILQTGFTDRTRIITTKPASIPGTEVFGGNFTPGGFGAPPTLPSSTSSDRPRPKPTYQKASNNNAVAANTTAPAAAPISAASVQAPKVPQYTSVPPQSATSVNPQTPTPKAPSHTSVLQLSTSTSPHEKLQRLKACLAAPLNAEPVSPAPATASSSSEMQTPNPSTPSVPPPSPAPPSIGPATGPATHPVQGQWQAGPGVQYPPMYPPYPAHQPQQIPIQGQYSAQPGFIQVPPGFTPEMLNGLMQFIGRGAPTSGWGYGGMGGAGNNPNSGGGHQ